MTLFCRFLGFVVFVFFWMLVRCTKFSQTQYRGFSGDDFFGIHFFLHSDIKLNFIPILANTVFVFINDPVNINFVYTIVINIFPICNEKDIGEMFFHRFIFFFGEITILSNPKLLKTAQVIGPFGAAAPLTITTHSHTFTQGQRVPLTI